MQEERSPLLNDNGRSVLTLTEASSLALAVNALHTDWKSVGRRERTSIALTVSLTRREACSLSATQLSLGIYRPLIGAQFHNSRSMLFTRVLPFYRVEAWFEREN